MICCTISFEEGVSRMSLATTNYLIINLSCLLCVSILYWHTGNDLASSLEIHLFKLLLIVFSVYLIDDSLWELAISKTISIPYQARGVLNAISLACQPILCYVWFLFAEIRLKRRLLLRRWFVPVTIAPVILSLILIFTSLRTGLIFYSDAVAEYHGPLYDLVMILDFIYLILVTLSAISGSIHTRSKSAKKGYFAMITFVLFSFAAGVFDSIVPNTPVMAPSILSALLLFFVNVQEMQIYTDALTGLNNRRRSDQVLEEYIEKADDANSFYMFMIDVNRFKLINDQYGHMEGDRALKAIAASLKRVASQYPLFLSRWGGDEFMIISTRHVAEPVKDFEKSLHQAVTENAKKDDLSYNLSISVGYALCSSSGVSPTDLTKKADQMLYEAKRIAHQTR
jgi:diguanylate cyclase (GGDEF)-like protein